MECKAFPPDGEIESIHLHRISLGCYQRMVRQELSHNLRTFNRRPGSMTVALASAGGILGLISYDDQGWSAHRKGGETFLLLDLAVPSTRYEHLSKLILRVALSREVRLLCERASKSRVHTAITTIFSKHPTSMKYRGMFKQTDKAQLPNGLYKLRYVGEFTNKPMERHFQEWLAEEARHARASSGGSADAGTATFQVAGLGS